jgi:nicotinate-nucleotide pyrophosphorylase (carboxylating)
VNLLHIEDTVRRALCEDLGHGDITTELLSSLDGVATTDEVSGRFLAKEDGVVCGTKVAACCFELLDGRCSVGFQRDDGELVHTGETIGEVRGPAAAVLGAERVALNFLQRLSGIATFARRLADQAKPQGIRVVETRKTTPGMRVLEKYAVRIGGGYNHRMDLDHAVMLKDNHFALAAKSMAGGRADVAAEVVRAVKAGASHTMKVIAEAGEPGMVKVLAEAGADVILLDNFTPDQVREAVKQIAGRATIELSGGINASNIGDYLIPGVDVISIGALTHSYRALDISLEL